MEVNHDFNGKDSIKYGKSFVPEYQGQCKNPFSNQQSNEIPDSKRLLGDQIRNFYLETVTAKQECREQNSQTNDTLLLKPPESFEPQDDYFDPRTSHHNIQISNQSTISLKSSKGISVHTLFNYAQNGNLRELRSALLSGVFDINIRDDFSWTLLMSAAYNGRKEVVKFLLNKNVDIKERNRRGYTAHDLALFSNNIKIAELIRNAGAMNVNDEPSNKLDNHCESTNSGTSSSINRREWCNICHKEFCLSTGEKNDDHMFSTTHLFNLQDKTKFHASCLIPSNNIGYKLMLKNGWRTNKGLGKHENGIKQPIKTALKQDRKGLGASTIRISKARVTHFNGFDTRIRCETSNKDLNVKTVKARIQELKNEKLWEKTMINTYFKR